MHLYMARFKKDHIFNGVAYKELTLIVSTEKKKSWYIKFEISCHPRICLIIGKSQDESLPSTINRFSPARLILSNDFQNPKVQAWSLLGFPDRKWKVQRVMPG